MGLTCSKCNRTNPSEAAYCYFDGAVLDSRGAAAGGPVRAGAREFGNPFVFPSGEVCKTFDQLAMACQKNWSSAAELLGKGYFETFLVGLGRVDLAQTAQKAAKFPDRERGLDLLLSDLPTDVLQPPKLEVEPKDINLGTMKVGDDRKMKLELSNTGMRLLYGSITAENCPWLTLGDGGGTPQKNFKFGSDQTIQLNVRGKSLRASSKPQEGKLIISTNGGEAIVTVKVEVPAKAFSGGVLAGAKSPRQAAEKAKANPKGAAALFENGEVAKWYKENGWTYPVQGPASSGLGAVQQFFEALGLTPPPKVEISERSLSLKGKAGEQLRHSIEIKAQEKRPVYAHAVSDQPWLEVGKARLNGRTATIPIVIPEIPNKSETLQAKIRVLSNGNQRFIIPVTISVAGAIVGGGGVFSSGAGAAAASASPLAFTTDNVASAAGGGVVSSPYYARRKQGNGLHWVPALLLIFCLLGGTGLEALWPYLFGSSSGQPSMTDLEREFSQPGASVIKSPGKIQSMLDKLVQIKDEGLKDPRPRIAVQFQDLKRRFGIVMTDEKDPINPLKFKRLTYHENGQNNPTCIKVDNHEYLFGQVMPGRWIRDNNGKGKEMDLVTLQENRRWKSVMEYPEGIRVTQVVQIVMGESTMLLDTCLVLYQIENNSQLPRHVGIRVLIDTFIGSNDGVPFAIPGQPDLVDTMREIPQKDIPDYIQALERSDLANPGTVAQIGLKIGGLEPMLSVLICRWPDIIGSEVRWRWQPSPMNVPPENKDSCVVLYWPELGMGPKEKRLVGYTYGLGRVGSVPKLGGPEVEVPTQGAGKMALTAAGNFGLKKEFTVMAYVKNPQNGQSVTLRLPEGLTLSDSSDPLQKPVKPEPGRDYTQVSWKVKSTSTGVKIIEADLKQADANLATAKYDVNIRSKGLFDVD